MLLFNGARAEIVLHNSMDIYAFPLLSQGRQAAPPRKGQRDFTSDL
jgi:hypothetical protein